MEEEAGDEAAGPKKGRDDKDDDPSTPVVTPDVTPRDVNEYEDSAKVEVVVVKLTRVPRWKRVLFLMSKRKSLMSHSWHSRTLISHQPFIIRRE